jgi:hypothetical protein
LLHWLLHLQTGLLQDGQSAMPADEGLPQSVVPENRQAEGLLHTVREGSQTLPCALHRVPSDSLHDNKTHPVHGLQLRERMPHEAGALHDLHLREGMPHEESSLHGLQLRLRNHYQEGALHHVHLQAGMPHEEGSLPDMQLHL